MTTATAPGSPGLFHSIGRVGRAALAALALTALALVGPFAAPPAAAQPYLVTDLNRTAGEAVSSYPGFIGNLDGRTVFVADDRLHGGEPWVSDGTAAGTLPLGDLVPGFVSSTPRSGVRAGDFLVFPTRDDAAGLSELWATDGTPAGTSLLAALPVLDRFSDPARVGAGAPGAPVLFSAYDDVRGEELWATDGTAAGTRLLADIQPGAGSSAPFGWVALGGRILFTAEDDLGRELWRTDGTAAGTVQVADVAPGPESSIDFGAEPDCGHDWVTVGLTGWLAPLGGAVLFVATDGIHGDELWRSDGTRTGTRMVADLTPGAESTRFFSRIEVEGGRAFFIAAAGGTGAQLWVTDGTATGTRQLSAFSGDAASDRCQLPSSFQVVDGRLYFLAGPTISDLWTSDGTAGGTRSLGVCAMRFCEEPSVPVATAAGLLFRGDDGVHGSEPWTTDGTPAGTRMIADLCPGECASRPGSFSDVGGTVVFAAVPESEVFIPVLWRTDGTAARTERVAGPSQVGALFPSPSAPGGAGPFLLFSGAVAASGNEPWRTDGTDAGTRLLADVAASGTGDAAPAELTPVGDRLFFVADDGVHGAEVWRTDGSAAGTVRLSDVAPGAPLPPNPAATEVGRLSPAPGGGVTFVAARGDVDAVEWWRTGPDGGSTHLLTIPREGLALDQLATAAAGGRLFLLGPGLWASDGTAAGTAKVGEFTFTNGPVVFAGELYFVVQVFDPFHLELWKSDGTAAGTLPVCTPAEGCEFFGLRDARVVGGRLLFVADAGQGWDLWRSDGTAAGTVEVRDQPPGNWPPYDLTVAGGRLIYFATGAAGTNPVLWSSDGTEAGTVEVAPTATDSFNGGLVPQVAALPGRACFVAAFDLGGDGGVICTDGTAGGTVRHPNLAGADRRLTGIWAAGGGRVVLLPERFEDSFQELWVSDLTPAGTVRLADLTAPMPALPIRLAVAGGRAFFAAVEADTGVELWAVDLAGSGGGGPGLPPGPEPPAAPDQLAATVVSASAVALSWRDNSADENRFVVEATSPLDWQFQVVAVVPADTRSTVVGGLVAGVPYTFRVHAENDGGPSPPSGEASATPFAAGSGPCAPAEAVLCLGAGRFAVAVWWRDQHNFGQGVGRAVPLTGSELTGAFWFFNPANLELLVKVLDGTAINGHRWFFYGGLTDVETWITLTDTQEGRNRTYHDPPGVVRGRTDTEAF